MSFFVSMWNKVYPIIKSIFVKDVQPVLIAWVNQFANEFGKLALVEAKEFAEQVRTGQKTMQQAGEELVSDLVKSGKVTAGSVSKDVAMNAIRTHLVK